MEKQIATLSFLLVLAVAFAYTLVITNSDHSADIFSKKVNEPACIDSDNGEFFLSAGYVTSTNGVQTRIRSDFCKSDSELTEYYCDGTTMKSVDYGCNCKDGSCQ